MRKEPLRVGFLGASTIAHKTWLAVHKAGHVVTYIGCRDPAKGVELTEWARKEILTVQARDGEAGAGMPPPFDAPCIGSYTDVIRADNVDVVYISLPTAKRAAWIRVCAQYGKHVVSEKPAACSAVELAECLRDMAANRLLFIDGTAFTHGQRLQDVQQTMEELGGPEHIETHMSFMASPQFMANDIRMQPLLEPHGALGDLGWYCIRWILHLVNFAVPTGITGRVTQVDALQGTKEEEAPKQSTTSVGVVPSFRKSPRIPAPAAITCFEGNMEFAPMSRGSPDKSTAESPAAVTAAFQCSFHDCHDQTVEIFCRDGTVTVHGAINPTADEQPGFTVRRYSVAPPPPTATRKESSTADAKEVFHAFEHLEIERDEVVHSSACGETNGAYQMEQLWGNVGKSVMRLGRNEPLLADATLAKKWSTFAYLTQVVMDRALDAASQHATAAKTTRARVLDP